jgi:nicotinamide riboside transporter PnuC
MINNLMWIVTVSSLVGIILNILKKKVCFVIWLITNTLWCIYDLYIANYPQAILFLIYIFLAIWGIYKWRK